MIYDEESLALLMEVKSKFPIYEKDGKKYVEKKLAKTKGSTVVDDIVIGTKRYQYIAQSDMEYYKDHPIEFLGKKIGSAVGTIAGAAVGGAGGAVAGAAVGGVAGTILGGAAGHRDGGTVGGGLAKSTKKGFDDTVGRFGKKILPKKEQYYRYKEYEDVIKEHFDIFGTDEETNALTNINEADQSAVLLSLTNKFYDYIITKVDDIDFGEIDITRGDITKLSNYKRMVQCLIDIINIIKEYKQETSLVNDVLTCIDNIESSRDLWVKSYNVHNPLGQTMYRTMTLACIEATAVLVVNTIDFIKSPSSDTFQASFDKIAYNKTKNGLLFENIRSFNSAYSKGQVAKAMNYVLEASKKNFVGEVGVGAGIVALSIIVINIIPILRELIFFFFYIRVSVADFFSIHANMIEMNLLNIDARKDLDKEKKKKISQKQKAIAEKFKAFANKIQVKTREAEYNTYKEIKANEKKYTASEVLENIPDSASSGSGSLF